VPRYPGVTSALGCVVADMRQDFVQTVNRLLDQVDAAALGAEMIRVGDETEALLEKRRRRLRPRSTGWSSSTCSISARPTR
jgi:N-methylhydantoinase A/oxoprolinase/acetone carboxylase beta subunit